MSTHTTANDIRALDAAHHIHPFTNTRELNEKGARVITRAEGVWLTDGEGNRILDGMAGLWCTAAGLRAGRDRRRGGRADAGAAVLQHLLPVHASACGAAFGAPGRDHAAAVQPVLLYLVRVGGDRHRDPPRHLLLATDGQARAQCHRLPARGVSRVVHRRGVGRWLRRDAQAGGSAGRQHLSRAAPCLVGGGRRP
jgi:hypothetical protein